MLVNGVADRIPERSCAVSVPPSQRSTSVGEKVIHELFAFVSLLCMGIDMHRD